MYKTTLDSKNCMTIEQESVLISAPALKLLVHHAVPGPVVVEGRPVPSVGVPVVVAWPVSVSLGLGISLTLVHHAVVPAPVVVVSRVGPSPVVVLHWPVGISLWLSISLSLTLVHAVPGPVAVVVTRVVPSIGHHVSIPAVPAIPGLSLGLGNS